MELKPDKRRFWVWFIVPPPKIRFPVPKRFMPVELPAADDALQLLRLVHKSFCFCLSKMPPAYCARGVKQEFGDSRDVTVILPSMRNQQIIAADHLGFAIGKQGKCEVGFAAQLP